MAIPVWLVTTGLGLRGSSLYTLRLAGRLPELGFAPSVVCPSAAPLPSRLRDQLAVIEAPDLGSRWFNGHAIRDLAARPDHPALLHGQRRAADFAVSELADALDLPYLLTVHDVLGGERLTIRQERLGAVVAVSPSVERDLVFRAGVPSDRVQVIPSGVEMPTKNAAPRAAAVDPVPVVGMASVLEPVKGGLYFLMAAELILSAGHDVEFVIAGDGPDEETLRRAARHLDIAHRVTFVNHVAQWSDLMANIDLFVVPSLEEGLSTIMLEAMALGKPVVATRVGGVADFFEDGEHALLVPKANHVALADRVRQLLDNPRRAARLAAAGQRRVREEFSVERMATETARVYRQVLERREKPRLNAEAPA